MKLSEYIIALQEIYAEHVAEDPTKDLDVEAWNARNDEPEPPNPPRVRTDTGGKKVVQVW